MERTNKLLIICGPTATGKTGIAVRLAKKFNGELVSADSRQVYREMDIGTGKDKNTIDVPIHLMDVVRPDEEFSVSHWVKLANSTIEDIQDRHKLPIVVGGTGLYIRALLHPPETMEIPPDFELRKKLKNTSVQDLQAMVDPAVLGRMNKSDRQNPRRLIRRIEIARTGQDQRGTVHTIDSLVIGLTAPLEKLYDRIDERVEKRLRQGMEAEVKRLIGKYGTNIPAMSAFGYRSLETWKRDEHAYAKRQLTWFRKQKDIHWFTIGAPDVFEKMTDMIVSWYTQRTDEHAD